MKTPLEKTGDAKSPTQAPLPVWRGISEWPVKRTGFAWERLSHFLTASAVPWRVWGTLLFLFMCCGSSEFRWVCSSTFSAKDAFGKVLRFPALWAYYWRKRYCFFFFFFWFKVLWLPLDILQISAESNLRNFWSLLVSPLKEKRKKAISIWNWVSFCNPVVLKILCLAVNLWEWLPEKSLGVVPQKWAGYTDLTLGNESPL